MDVYPEDPQIQHESKQDVYPNDPIVAKQEAKSDNNKELIKSEIKSDITPEVKAEPKHDAVPEVKAEAKPEVPAAV